MKKVFLFLGVVAMFTLASCNKEKNCKCTTSMSGFPDAVTTLTIQEGDCSDMDATQSVAGVTQTVKCVEE